MTSKQRAYLKGLAQTMEPIFQIGKNSLTPENTKAIAEALEARELIKISVLQNCMDDPKELAALVGERTRSQVVQVMQAVDFCVRYALLVERPLVINLSFGNNYGSHSGQSLLETYLNAVSNLGQHVICIGSGNEGDTGRHYAGNLKSDRKSSGQTHQQHHAEHAQQC